MQRAQAGQMHTPFGSIKQARPSGRRTAISAWEAWRTSGRAEQVAHISTAARGARKSIVQGVWRFTASWLPPWRKAFAARRQPSTASGRVAEAERVQLSAAPTGNALVLDTHKKKEQSSIRLPSPPAMHKRRAAAYAARSTSAVCSLTSAGQWPSLECIPALDNSLNLARLHPHSPFTHRISKRGSDAPLDRLPPLVLLFCLPRSPSSPCESPLIHHSKHTPVVH